MSESTGSAKRRHPARRARRMAGALSALGVLSLSGYMATSSVTTAVAPPTNATDTRQNPASATTDDPERWSATPSSPSSSVSSSSYAAPPDTSSHAS